MACQIVIGGEKGAGQAATGRGRVGKTGAEVRPGGGGGARGSFWLSAATERYQKHFFFIIKLNFSLPVQAERSSAEQGREEGGREKRREGGREGGRGGKEEQQQQEEDKNTHPHPRNSF